MIKVAVVGAGPAGFYVTRALLRACEAARVDLFERLPAPHGLVRYGVAPDHASIRGVGRLFDRTLEDPGVRLFANVALGEQLDRDELRRRYHAVVYAPGASESRDLGIPGESLAGSLAATEVVGWYNGHPDAAGVEPPLDGPQAAVLGMGNVALDVARVLARDPAELARTDIAGAALAALERSRVRDVTVIGRRGPSQASFSPAVLEELAALEGVQVLVDPEDLARDKPGGEDDRAGRNLALLRACETAPDPAARARVRLVFFRSPVALVGERRVRALVLERNRLVQRGERLRAEGTGEREALPAQLVIRAVGYLSRPLPGVPFDEARGVIPSREGRVLSGDRVLPGEYASGWARRGPQGVVGTNRVDAEQVVQRLLEDLPGLPEPVEEGDIAALLRARGARWVDAAGWAALEEEEARRGALEGRAAARLTDVGEMLDFLTSKGLNPE